MPYPPLASLPTAEYTLLMVRTVAVSLTILAAILIGALFAWNLYSPSAAGMVGSAPGLGLPSFDTVAAAAKASVVSVTADSIVVEEDVTLEDLRRMREHFGRLDEGEQIPDLPTEPRTGRETRTGTGLIIDSSGFIVTNFHVVHGAHRVLVDSLDQSSMIAHLVGADPETDLALLKVDPPKPLEAARLADSDNVRVGEWVLAIGDPLTFQGTVTVGIVSGTGRRLGDGMVTDYIQTDAAINVGNSGGPLLNARGEVIGINTAISRISGGMSAPTIIEGVGFAIPANTVDRVTTQLRKIGRVPRGFLGITIESLTPDAAEGLGMPGETGALVMDVRHGWPAEEAGLRPGDVILELEGEDIASADDLIAQVSDRAPESEVALLVLRPDDGRRTMTATLTDRSRILLPFGEENLGSDPVHSFPLDSVQLGFDVRNAEEGEIAAPVVESVDPLSRAWDEGIRPGARILELNGSTLKGAGEFQTALEEVESGTVVRLLVVEGDWGPAPRFLFLRSQ